MSKSLDVEIALVRPKRGRPAAGASVAVAATPRIPRIARLMALAIKFQGMVDKGEVRDYADLARLGMVTRARLTQIMNLTLLAPDIQEQILGGESEVHCERVIRGVVRGPFWSEQRRALETRIDRESCGADSPNPASLSRKTG